MSRLTTIRQGMINFARRYKWRRACRTPFIINWRIVVNRDITLIKIELHSYYDWVRNCFSTKWTFQILKFLKFSEVTAIFRELVAFSSCVHIEILTFCFKVDNFWTPPYFFTEHRLLQNYLLYTPQKFDIKIFIVRKNIAFLQGGQVFALVGTLVTSDRPPYKFKDL